LLEKFGDEFNLYKVLKKSVVIPKVKHRYLVRCAYITGRGRWPVHRLRGMAELLGKRDAPDVVRYHAVWVLGTFREFRETDLVRKAWRSVFDLLQKEPDVDIRIRSEGYRVLASLSIPGQDDEALRNLLTGERELAVRGGAFIWLSHYGFRHGLTEGVRFARRFREASPKYPGAARHIRGRIIDLPEEVTDSFDALEAYLARNAKRLQWRNHKWRVVSVPAEGRKK